MNPILIGHHARVSITSIDDRPDTEAPENRDRLPVNLAGARTPLAAELSEIQAAWLLEHAVEQWEILHRSLGDWRTKMDRWEAFSKEDYSTRVGQPDPTRPDAKPDIFTWQNDTLGLAAGFWDFFTAQARNDIFGTRPWLTAAPEGRADATLAELVSRHSQWKLNQSNLEEVCKDAISVAGWGGTGFVKSRWRKEIETFRKTAMVLYPKGGKEPIVSPVTGDFIRKVSEAEELGIDGDLVRWDKAWTEETVTVFDNTLSTLVHHSDIAFDETAADLDLYFTDVFVRFRMGILDVIDLYGIEKDQWNDLRMSLAGSDEQAGPLVDASSGIFGMKDNQVVSLVEGFVRCDPFQTGRPIRAHVIFSPTLRILFSVDYLANVTPDGLLPVFPVRIHKRPGKLLGVGFFEKYENANNAIDRQYNAVTKRNAESSSVISAIQPDALADKAAAKDFVMDPTKPFKLAPGKSILDFIGFASIPDINNRSIELLNQMMQMGQMRSGITSAAQGELKGVPSNNTATGVRDLQSRGAILLKSQIDECTADIRDIVEFNTIQIYANQNTNETFTWGEGESRELLTLEAETVQGIKMNVSLTMAQAQNVARLETARAAIETFARYVQVPEIEKPAARPMFTQAISSLGFRNAEDIIRRAAVDPEGVLGLLPPEMAGIVQQAFAQAGLIAPPTPMPGDPADAMPAETMSLQSTPPA